MEPNNSKKIYIILLIAVVIICGAAIYFFAIKNKTDKPIITETKTDNSISPDEIKKKELELKERELDLKEKELKNKSSTESNIPFTKSYVENFVNNWVNFQTKKNYTDYINCYSTDFKGIKRTKTGKASSYGYSDWTQDRVKMYSAAKNLYINIADFQVKEINNVNETASVQFTQYYSSNDYNDQGQKILKIRKENGLFKIYYEEMLYSFDSDEEGD
ncbi:hypothetical protein BH10BAC5_BH10BAC5_25710 [soil metagenome]